MSWDHFYILDDKHRIIDVGPITDHAAIMRWGIFRQEHREKCIVAQTYVGKAREWWVSTVFLGMDHRIAVLEQGPPLLFETMVFHHAPIESRWNHYREWWSTWNDARAGHIAICHELDAVITATEAAEKQAMDEKSRPR